MFMKTVSACAFFLASLVVAAAPAFAQGDAPTTGNAVKKTHAKKHIKKTAARKNAHVQDADDPEPDITGQLPVDFDCELGDKLTIYRAPGDNEHIALRWHKRLHQMTRVRTTTGADRFENPRLGLVWIGIPAKSMLLDSKNGHQLANECRDSEQAAALHSVQHLAGGPH